MIAFFKQLDHTTQAFLATLFTWGITALGASVVFCFKKVNQTILDAMLAFASGVMLAASFWSLLEPSIKMAETLNMIPWFISFLGFFSGGLLLYLGDKLYPKGKKKRTLLLISSITLHNIPEGLAVGVAFGSLTYGLSGVTLGGSCLLALGIGLQNFPEGTAVSVPLLREGMSRKKAFFIGQLSGIVEPIFGILGAILVLKVRTLLPFLLAFAAGAMIYVIVEELIPESQTNKRKDQMALFTLIGFSIMMILDVALG